MRVTILGHASLFFENDDERILLDPVLRTTGLLGSLVHQYPRKLDLERLPKPTLIVITHAHFDHFDPETLTGLAHDIPILIPPDRRMSRKIEAMGFSEIVHLETWDNYRHGSLRLTATPSDAPVTEFGLIVDTEDARFWHMSDAEPQADTAAVAMSRCGPIDVVSTKFQPADPQLHYQHNMGSSFDRHAVAQWLETACACAPKLAFPYASGLCIGSERRWINRLAFPFSDEFVADLLGRRLAGIGASAIVRPGDAIDIATGRVTHEEQISPFVSQAGPATRVDWEPFDHRLLSGMGDAEEQRQFESELAQVLLGGEFAEWLTGQLGNEKSRLRSFGEWQVLGQIVVHFGPEKRWHAQVDFRGDEPKVRSGKTQTASYFMHIGADAARRLLNGESSALEAMLEGNVFIHERLLAVIGGRIDAPDTTRIYKDFPDPLLVFAGARRSAKKRKA